MEEINNLEKKDKFYNDFRIAFDNEIRLIKRYYEFCYLYNSFEFDEMGINMDEADLLLGKANKIKNKIFNNILNTIPYKIENIKTNEVYYKILFDIIDEDEIANCIIKINKDSFDLEVN